MVSITSFKINYKLKNDEEKAKFLDDFNMIFNKIYNTCLITSSEYKNYLFDVINGTLYYINILYDLNKKTLYLYWN